MTEWDGFPKEQEKSVAENGQPKLPWAPEESCGFKLSHIPDLRNSAEPRAWVQSGLCFVAAVLPSYKYLLGEVRKADSSQQCPVIGLEAMVRNWNTWISTKQRKIFFTVRVAALEQVVHRGCGLSIPVDIQNPTGHRTEQRALAEPVWEWELD